MSATADALAAYLARIAAGNADRETPPLGTLRAALADRAWQELAPLGLTAAYPTADGLPRAIASDPPFFFSRKGTGPGRIEQITLGGHPALGAVPGGEVVLHWPLDACVAVGPSAGDLGALYDAADTWLLNLTWFFSLDRTIGGLVQDVAFERSEPTAGDVRWGADWYCVIWPLSLECRWIIPAG